jgi:hypothetical protein
MQLVDQSGALADNGLEPASDLAQKTQGSRDRLAGSGSFSQGKASSSAGLDGVGLLGAEQRGAIIFVALRIATGEDDGGVGNGASGVARSVAEMGKEVKEVVCILPGGIEANDESDSRMTLCEQEQTLAEQMVARGGLGEGKFGGSGLKVVTQEAGVVAIARGVDANAKADRQGGRRCGRRIEDRVCGHGKSPKRKRKGDQDARVLRQCRLMRKLVIRGQSLRM